MVKIATSSKYAKLKIAKYAKLQNYKIAKLQKLTTYTKNEKLQNCKSSKNAKSEKL